jgi:hypothetical protein
MDPFVRRLVQRLLDPAQPLSRNRHFHTFQSDEGRVALKTTRRLLSLQRDLQTCRDEGGVARAVLRADEPRGWLIELRLKRQRGVRSTWLAAEELELLRSLPGVAELLPLAQTEGAGSASRR